VNVVNLSKLPHNQLHAELAAKQNGYKTNMDSEIILSCKSPIFLCDLNRRAISNLNLSDDKSTVLKES